MIKNSSLEESGAANKDILQTLSVETLCQYRDFCSKNIPKGVRAYLYLKCQIEWIERLKSESIVLDDRSPYCMLDFYGPVNGIPENCTFIAITRDAKNRLDYALFVFSMEESQEELFRCFEETRLIDWHRGPFFVSMESESNKCLHRFIDERKIDCEFEFEIPNIMVYLPKEEAQKIDYKLPEELYLSKLEPNHSDIIDRHWPHRFHGSLNWIQNTIILNGGIGLFNRTTNQLIGWVVKNDHNVPGFLQVIDSEKGKGYGKLLVKAFIKKYVNEDDIDILAFINCTNIISMSLFFSLNFVQINEAFWLRIRSKQHSRDYTDLKRKIF